MLPYKRRVINHHPDHMKETCRNVYPHNGNRWKFEKMIDGVTHAEFFKTKTAALAYKRRFEKNLKRGLGLPSMDGFCKTAHQFIVMEFTDLNQ